MLGGLEDAEGSTRVLHPQGLVLLTQSFLAGFCVRVCAGYKAFRWYRALRAHAGAAWGSPEGGTAEGRAATSLGSQSGDGELGKDLWRKESGNLET